jgi:hypothetical protein
VVLVAPPYAEQMEELDDDEIIATLLSLLCRTFCPTLSSLPPLVEYRITRWGSDPYCYGSYSFDKLGCKPMQRAELRAAETPRGGSVPRLFFAGEACSIDAPQCVHGAVDTGREAAAELVRSIALHEYQQLPSVRPHLRDGPLLCRCRAVFDPARETVACTSCGRRYHNECVGVPLSSAGAPAAQADGFRCLECAQRHD